ncbi:hypothetical protein DYB30_009669, partial [Aphanomyces astaci]
QARELGRVEGRAEALEEIASLHAQIASLYGQIEDMALSQEGRTKALMSDVYKEIKATFKQHTELLAPKQVVEICKPSLRRVAELHLGNITRIPESDTPTTSSPRSQLHRSQTCAASMNTTAESSMHEVPSRRNSAPSPISTDAAALHRSEPPSDDLPPTTIVSISGSEKIGTGHSAYMVYWIVAHKHGVVRLLQHLSMFISSWPLSPYTHSFLHDAILHPDSIALPRSTTPSSSSSIMINSTKAMGPAHAKQRMNRSFKSLHEAVPPLQRRLQMVTKQSEEVVQAHVAMATAVEAMRRHCDIVQSFEHSYETPTKHENSVADVLPRFERQVHELGKDMTATNVDKVAVEWDELSVVRAKTLMANLVQGAMQLEARHGAIRDEWTALRQHLVDTSHPMWKVRVRQQSREEVPPLVHPTLGRPLKPWSMRPDEEGDVDDEAAAALFGVAGYAGPARRRRREDGEMDEATAARTLFGGEEDEEASSDDGGKPIEKPPVVPGDWDLYIERLRRKQLTKAKRAFAAASQEQQAADDEERRQWHEGHRVQQEKDAEEAVAHSQRIDAAVASWAHHKDVQAMLNSLHEIFPFKDMRQCHVTDDATVKKGYMKAVRLLHPDKLLPADFSMYERMLGQHLFSTLTSAYENRRLFLRRSVGTISLRFAHTTASIPAAETVLQAVKPTNDDEAIHVTWKDGVSSTFHRAWLRDNCTCPSCQHPTTLQRQILTSAIPLHPTGHASLYANNSSGSDCVRSEFPATWLREHAYGIPSDGYDSRHYRQQRVDTKSLWGNDFTLPSTTYDAMMDDGSGGFKDGMAQLQKFGVLLIKHTPSSMDATEAFARRIGFVLETIYGRMWTTRPVNPENAYKDTASTNLALGPHTDCTYLYEPPGLQIFNCVLQAAAANADEGASRFVDGFHVVEWLRKYAPDAFQFFCDTALPQYCVDDDVSLHVMRPLIQRDGAGNVELVRFNDYDRAPLTHLSHDQVAAYYKHHKTLWDVINAVMVYKMDEGDMIVVDNHRVMHGRHAFQGERALIGCYIGRSEYDSRLRTLGLL